MARWSSNLINPRASQIGPGPGPSPGLVPRSRVSGPRARAAAAKLRTIGRWTPVIAHALVVTPALLAAWLGGGASAVFLFGSIAVLVGYPFVIRLEAKLTPLRIGPLTYFFVWEWATAGLAAFWKGIDVVKGAKTILFMVEVPVADMATGYALYLVGLLSFHVGVTLLRPGPDDSSPSTFRGDRFALLWAVGVVARLMRSRLGWAGSVIALLGGGSAAALAATAIQGAPGARVPPRRWALLLGGTGIEFVIGLFGNSKGQAMLSALPIVWMALRSRRPRRNLLALVVGGAVVYGFVVFPLVTAARNSGEFSATSGYYSAKTFARAGDNRGDLDLSPLAVLDGFLDRIFVPAPLGFFVSEVRILGFQRGATMTYLDYAFVPRFLWEDKPIVSRGGWFYEYFGGEGTSLGQSAAGELFWNFGTAGIMVGMVAMGLLFGFLWRLAGPDPRGSPIRMLLYLDLLFGAPGMMEGEWGSGFVGLVYRVALFTPLMWARWSGREWRATPVSGRRPVLTPRSPKTETGPSLP